MTLVKKTNSYKTHQPSWRFWDEKESKHQEGARGNTYTLGNNMNDDFSKESKDRKMNRLCKIILTKPTYQRLPKASSQGIAHMNMPA